MTFERKISKIFGLEGDEWLEHANPFSVVSDHYIARIMRSRLDYSTVPGSGNYRIRNPDADARLCRM